MGTVGERLQKALSRTNTSRAALARKLHSSPVAGASHSTIGRYVRGEESPRVEFVAATARVLGVSERWLLTGDGGMFGAEKGEELSPAWELAGGRAGAGEEDRKRFARKLRDKLPQYEAFTKLQRALLGNAFMRQRITQGAESDAPTPEARAREFAAFGRRLLDDWQKYRNPPGGFADWESYWEALIPVEGAGEVRNVLASPEFTDFLTARVHAANLALGQD